MKICVIGCGGIAVNAHGPSYMRYKREHPDILFSACCDINESKAAAFKEKFGFERYYTNYVQMLEIEKPDAVCLLCSVNVAAEIAVKISKMGIPLMMEKPPGRNTEETLKIIEACTEYKILNQVAFNRRHIPLIRELKKHLSETADKQIHHIRYDFYRINRKDEDFSTTAIHGIDTVRHLADSDYKYIRFHYQELPHIGQNVANIYMDCVMQSGTAAFLSFCPVSGSLIERVTVNCHEHTFFLNIPVWSAMDTPGSLIHLKNGKIMLDVTGIEISDGTEMFEESGFYAENKLFFQNLSKGIAPADDIKSGLQSVEVAECIRKRTAEYISGE